MIEVENSVVIDKPAGEVFSLVGDPSKDPQWHFDVVEAGPAAAGSNGNGNGAGPTGAGSKYRWVFDYMGEGRQEATAEIKLYELDQRLEILAVAGPLVQTIGYKLEALGPTSTLFTRVLALSHDEIPSDMEEAMKPRIENRGALYLARLRQVLEGGPIDKTVNNSCSCCEV